LKEKVQKINHGEGYVLKNAEPKNLLRAISEVYNGGAQGM
jgi:DNA-binding NarL/FixJ family response regulator